MINAHRSKMNARSLVVFVFLAVGMVIAIPISHVNAQAPTSPVISFSADLKTVSISYQGHAYTMPRPVVPATTFTPASGGRYWWVATTGSDTNAGTETAPFRAITKGIAVAQAGDVIYIKAGTYAEVGGIQISKSGVAGRNMVISSAPGDLGKVWIRLPDASLDPALNVIGIHSANYVTINGLVIEGARDRLALQAWGGTRGAGILWQNGAGAGNIATNNVVFGTVGTCIKEAGHGGEGILIEGNLVFDCGNESRDHGIYVPTSNEIVRGNISFLNPGYGIHAYSNPSNLLIERNVVFDNLTGGILLATDHTKVYNNIVYKSYDPLDCQNHRDVVGIFYYSEASQNNDVRNNIFMNACYANARFDTGPQCVGANGANTCLDDYNVYYNSPNVGTSLQERRGVGDPPYFIRGSHELYADPLFVNPGIGDFRLQPNSPAIDRGVNIGMPYNGSVPDLGAYETTGGTPIPVTPIVTPSPTQTISQTATTTCTAIPTAILIVILTAILTAPPTVTLIAARTHTPSPAATPTRRHHWW